MDPTIAALLGSALTGCLALVGIYIQERLADRRAERDLH